MTPVRDSSMPLAGSLARIDRALSGIVAHVGEPGDGWIRPDLIGQAGAFQVLAEVARQQTGWTDRRSVGAMMAWRVGAAATVAVLTYSRERRVPVLDASTTWFSPYTSRQPTRLALGSPRFSCLPDDCAAAHQTADVVPNEQALRVALATALERFIRPAIEPLARALPIPPSELWALATSEVVLQLVRAWGDRGDPERGIREAREVMGLGSAWHGAVPGLGVVEHRGRLHAAVSLRACCGADRWPSADGERCSICPRLSEAGRARRLVARVSTPLATVAVPPEPVRGGKSTTGYVELRHETRTGTVVQLISDDARLVRVPPAVVVPRGQRGASFPVTTSAPRGGLHGSATISAAAGGVTRSTTVDIVPRRRDQARAGADAQTDSSERLVSGISSE